MSAVAEEFPPLFLIVLATGLLLFAIARPLFAQATVGTGGIVGTVGDPSGGVMSGATVAITNIATRQIVNDRKECLTSDIAPLRRMRKS